MSATNGHVVTEPPAPEPEAKPKTSQTALKTRVEQLEAENAAQATQLRELTAGYAQLHKVVKKMIASQAVEAALPNVKANLTKQVEARLEAEGFTSFLSGASGTAG